MHTSPKTTLLLGTRKGLIVYRKTDSGWTYDGDHFRGIPVSYAVKDERNGAWWACLDHGHWGTKLHVSHDEGQTWKEIPAPSYPEGEEIKPGVPATTTYLWVLQPGSAATPDRLYLGTEPGGLFQSDDGGQTWSLNQALWAHPSRMEQWFGAGRDHPGIHSIIVDPKDPDHVYVGISVAGVFETRDGGASWHPANKGLKAEFLPDQSAEVGQDPHLLAAAPSNPQVMWQQNHCGIFVSRDGSATWQDVSEAEGPANFGFAIAIDEQDAETAWVVPGLSDTHRVAVDCALCVCRTEDGGKTWTRLANGLPQTGCYDITYRHALDITGDTLCFGSTTGNVYVSEDRGDNWVALSHSLPMVYSVRFAS